MPRDTARATPSRHRRRRALVVVAAALVPVLASTLAACSPKVNVTFAAATYTGGPPLAVGDLNGDGYPDVVSAGFTNTNFDSYASVLLNDGTGGFPTEAHYPVDIDPTAAAIGDLNGDGHPDVVTANYYLFHGDVSVLLSNGAGGFAAAVNYPVGASNAQPMSVAIGDLNGDGHPDLVTANCGSDDVSVLLGDGTGGFAAAVDYPVGGSTGACPKSVAIGDFNSDGHPDLITANAGRGDVSLLLGDGKGGFAAAVTFPVGASNAQPLSVAIGDLNGDGALDVVTANIGSRDLSVLLGDGAASFFPAEHFAAGSARNPVVIADVNHDGKPDLVFTGGILLNTTANFGS